MTYVNRDGEEVSVAFTKAELEELGIEVEPAEESTSIANKEEA